MRFALLWLLLASALALGQDEFIDIPPVEEKKLEWSGNLDAKYGLYHMDQGSAIYRLQFYGAGDISAWLSQYRIEPYLNADYRTGDLGFHLKTHATYLSDDNASVDLFEAYASFNPSFNSTLQAGKRVYNWGKGYAFNPAGYVNPVKDPENPELAQAGLLSANFEYIKSFSSPLLQSLAVQLVVMPSPPLYSGRYEEAEKTDVALKSYFLLMDTDIDLMGYYSQAGPRRIGFDFARNLKENLALHGEWSYSHHAQRYTIAKGAPLVQWRNQFSYLLGLRYLHSSNTTLIAEYYHNGSGLNESEFSGYLDFLAAGAASDNSAIVRQTLEQSQNNFRSSTLMRDYLYLKFSMPEPFDWLYFTPSLYTLYNLSDRSFLLSTPISYKPVTNVEFIFWPAFLFGDPDSEFGHKQLQQRLEVWMRAFF